MSIAMGRRPAAGWLLCGLLGLAAVAEARPIDRRSGELGVGAVFGSPTAVSGKLWLGGGNAVDAALGWDFVVGELRLHADYLWHWFNVTKVEKGRLPLYIGVGGSLSLGNRAEFGVRVPLGIAYHFANDPVEIFLEVAPGLRLSPSTGATAQGGIGGRYYF